MAFPHDGKKFKKGESGNPHGKPRKWLSIATGEGYKKEEAIETAINILAKTHDEIKSIAKDKQSTVLETIIAKALLKSIQSGSLWNLDSLMDRVFGKATENKNLDVKGDLKTAVTVTVIKSEVPVANSEKEIVP